MKARTAKERAIEALTAQYIVERDVEMKAIQEAARPHHYVRMPLNRKAAGVWCTNCGGVIEYNPDLLINQLEEKKRPVTCPHCGAKITNSKFRQMGVGHEIYRDWKVALKVENYGPWQVLRYFYVPFDARLGKEPKMGTPIEIVRRWYNIDKGGRAIVWSTGRVGSWYGCGFAINQDLTLKREGRASMGYYGNDVDYIAREDVVVPAPQWHKLLKRDGFKGAGSMRLIGIDSCDVPIVFRCPQLVTLYKSHQFSLLRYYSADAQADLRKIREDWPSLRVALRHGYRITDPGLYHDYLRQLRELGEDVLSPHWICPENLRLAHHRTETRIQRKRKALKIEEEKKRAAAAEEKYARKIAPFRDLRLSAAGVVIAVIPSVEDVRQEGEHMHHCVFSMKYYEREESLLLSARSAIDGSRLETIEFDLFRGKVAQSRAACNGTSKKHKTILNLMASSADKISEIYKRTAKKAPKTSEELARAFV